MKRKPVIRYNSPVVLTFALISLASLAAGKLTGGISTSLLFCVYRSPFSDPLTYLRFFTHVFGHANLTHYMSNILLILVVGPSLEEKYGSRAMLISIAVTALITGLFQFIVFPHTALLGASGIVFMMIVMSSLAGFEDGTVPLTLILVTILYLGNELVAGFTVSDNISQVTHIIGGICGALLGLMLAKKRLRGKYL